MKHLIICIFAAAVLLTGCKTSEANYRAAYERAVENRDSRTSLDSTVYGAHRRNMNTTLAVAGTDTVEMRTQRVKITEGGGAIPEWLRTYSVVVGQFKQIFNAESMRDRLVDSGYPRTFIIETAEPYYYIVLASYDTEAEAVAEIARLRTDRDFPVTMRSPLPYILRRP